MNSVLSPHEPGIVHSEIEISTHLLIHVLLRERQVGQFRKIITEVSASSCQQYADAAFYGYMLPQVCRDLRKGAVVNKDYKNL